MVYLSIEECEESAIAAATGEEERCERREGKRLVNSKDNRIDNRIEVLALSLSLARAARLVDVYARSIGASSNVGHEVSENR